MTPLPFGGPGDLLAKHVPAMALLHAGVDTSTIALRLGHASTKATDIYMPADTVTLKRLYVLS